MADFFNGRKLNFALDKCNCTLFTSDPKQYKTDPKVEIHSKRVPNSNSIKVLAVTLDSGLTFTKHVKDVTARYKKRLNVMRALSGTTWGQSKETLLVTYKSLIRPILKYASAAWGPTTNQTNITSLQRVQNAALRIATGCLLMTNEDHLCQKTNILPVRRHVRLLCVQQQLSRYLTYHPSHSFLHKHPLPRQTKETLHTRYNRYVTPYLNETENNTQVTPKECKGILKDMHTLEVNDAIENYAPSMFLKQCHRRYQKTRAPYQGTEEDN